LILGLALASATSVHAQYVQDNKADPFLKGFDGAWDGVPVGPNPEHAQQVVSARMTLNNRYLYLSITERLQGHQPITYASEMYVGYDPESKKYDAYIFDTIGFTHLSGTHTEKSLVLTMTAADGHVERLTLTQDSADAFTRVYETSRDGKEFTTFSSAHYTRRQGEVIRRMPVR
jgi:hypothetical protein